MDARHVRWLMERHKISNKDITRDTGISDRTINRARSQGTTNPDLIRYLNGTDQHLFIPRFPPETDTAVSEQRATLCLKRLKLIKLAQAVALEIEHIDKQLESEAQDATE